MEHILTDQQQEAVEKFSRLKVGALFMQMGTGKTLAAVTIVNHNRPNFLLYLAPYSTIANVTAELEKWHVCCPYKVVGYESIAASDRIMVETETLLNGYERCFIVADESIFIKSGKSKRHTRAVRLRKKCEWALILNGTPVVKDEWDLFNQMNFLSPKIIPMHSFEFMEKFFVEHRIWQNGRKRKYYTFYEPNRPVLTKLISPYVYEADLRFELDEKDKTIFIECDDEEYENAKDEILSMSLFDYDTLIQLFQTLNRVSACSPEKNAAVAEYIKGKRVICYCGFLDEVQQISELCNCFVITGDTPAEERQKIIQEFEISEKPLLMTLGTGAYGLNLQFCSEIVYSSLSFNFGLIEQSRYRIKRVGQKNDIKYTYIIADFKINEMLFANLDKKESLSNAIKQLLRKDVKQLRKELRAL